MRRIRTWVSVIAVAIVAGLAAPQASATVKININTASKRMLEKLPGVGAGKAEKIIRYRRFIGSFDSVDELRNVPGIGDRTVKALQENVTVGALASSGGEAR